MNDRRNHIGGGAGVHSQIHAAYLHFVWNFLSIYYRSIFSFSVSYFGLLITLPHNGNSLYQISQTNTRSLDENLYIYYTIFSCYSVVKYMILNLNLNMNANKSSLTVTLYQCTRRMYERQLGKPAQSISENRDVVKTWNVNDWGRENMIPAWGKLSEGKSVSNLRSIFTSS